MFPVPYRTLTSPTRRRRQRAARCTYDMHIKKRWRRHETREAMLARKRNVSRNYYVLGVSYRLYLYLGG